jgi:hypothetical protein
MHILTPIKSTKYPPIKGSTTLGNEYIEYSMLNSKLFISSF